MTLVNVSKPAATLFQLQYSIIGFHLSTKIVSRPSLREKMFLRPSIRTSALNREKLTTLVRKMSALAQPPSLLFNK